MSDKIVPDIPETMPTMGNAFVRWFGRNLLRLQGWKFKGELPREKKVMVVAAPHTSNWDFVVGMAAIMALGLQITFFMKKEAFFWPVAGLWKKLGGKPIDRSRAQDVSAQQVAEFERNEKIWVAITPEGTRSKVTRWKSGFVRIAHAANVPILVVGFNATSKEVVLDKVVPATDDFEGQAEDLRQYTNQIFVGIRPENQ